MTTQAPPDVELVYVGDPMCSWCWGFAPALAVLSETFDLPLRVVLGGLSPGRGLGVLTPKLAATIAHHWRQVEERTGQPFDHSVLERRAAAGDWYYDTELPCVAVATMRQHAPDQALAFMARLQHAFYAEGIDLTELAAYPPLVEGFAPDPAGFVAELATDEARQRAWADFAWARKLGVSGFPSLLLREGTEWSTLTQGWAPTEDLVQGLRRWLDQRHEGAEAGMLCSVDGECG